MASPTSTRHQPSRSEGFSQQALDTLLAYRVEILFLAFPAGIYVYLHTMIRAPIAQAGTVAGLVAAGLLMLPATRHRLTTARIRRRWDRAATDAGLRFTTVRKVEPVKIGTLLAIQVRGGHSIEDIATKRQAIAASLGVQEIRIIQDRGHAGRAHVTLVTADPFTDMASQRWPGLDIERTDYWEPAPIALGEMADLITINGARQSVLIGGITGGGKSVLVNMLAAWAARDPRAEIYLIDGKRIELRHWAPFAERFESEPEAALEVLQQVAAEIDRRGEWLADQPGIRLKLEPEDGFGPLVVIIEELADFTLSWPKRGKEFDAALGVIARKGRYVAASAIAVTQVPYVNVISGGTRNNFPIRVAFRCGSLEQSRAILGDSAVDASRLSNTPGRCLVAGEDGGWRRAATFNTSADLEEMVAQAERVRGMSRAA